MRKHRKKDGLVVRDRGRYRNKELCKNKIYNIDAGFFSSGGAEKSKECLAAFQGFSVPPGGKKTSQDVKFILAQRLSSHKVAPIPSGFLTRKC